jgi:hypothetical protein
VERRKASGRRDARCRAPRMFGRQRLDVRCGHWLDAPLGAPPPFFVGEVRGSRFGKPRARTKRAARTGLFFHLSPLAGRDEACIARTLALVFTFPEGAAAPPTALLQGAQAALIGCRNGNVLVRRYDLVDEGGRLLPRAERAGNLVLHRRQGRQFIAFRAYGISAT